MPDPAKKQGPPSSAPLCSARHCRPVKQLAKEVDAMARCGVAVLVLILLACVAAAAAAGGGDHHHRRGSRASARLQLVPAAPGASLAERARDDRHRHAYISTRLASSSRRRAAETSTAPGPEASAFAMPLTSGAYTGTGQYFVRFRVGTPAQPFVLVADTGSDLTWVKCRGASSPSAASPSGSPRVFRPADSKSWAPFPCSSDTCKSYVPFSLANCSAGTAPCSYDYRSVPPPLPSCCFSILARSGSCDTVVRFGVARQWVRSKCAPWLAWWPGCWVGVAPGQGP
uniref:Peptidase A1 domain-containing protein n=1 Tax=Aegilops tauschii subsp. strangulata TaxID=200361 RepID=A0A452ZV09_AEGTS